MDPFMIRRVVLNCSLANNPVALVPWSNWKLRCKIGERVWWPIDNNIIREQDMITQSTEFIFHKNALC